MKKTAELVFIVDRSGSMSDIASDMEGAIKSVLKDQKKEYEGDIRVTFVRFDSEYEEVFASRPIGEVEDIKIEPRGMTALLDAMGRTINNFERKFSEAKKKDRPERVLFLIITDGKENDSREFSRDKVFGIVETVKKDHEWGFTFIGANQDAIAEGGNLGVDRGSSLDFSATAKGVRCMSQSLSSFTSSFLRDGKAEYSEEDNK